jgi:hypothetical protein
MTYYGSGCLIDNRCYWLPIMLNLYFLHKFKAAVDEWTVQQKLFVLPNIDCKIILYKLWKHFKNDYATGNIVTTSMAHTVKVLIIMV